MTDVLDDVRDHYRATGLTKRLKTALMALGMEDQSWLRGDWRRPHRAIRGCRALSDPAPGPERASSFQTARGLELPIDDGRFDAVLLQHVATNISGRARLCREIRRSRFATFDAVLNGAKPHYRHRGRGRPQRAFL